MLITFLLSEKNVEKIFWVLKNFWEKNLSVSLIKNFCGCKNFWGSKWNYFRIEILLRFYNFGFSEFWVFRLISEHCCLLDKLFSDFPSLVFWTIIGQIPELIKIDWDKTVLSTGCPPLSLDLLLHVKSPILFKKQIFQIVSFCLMFWLPEKKKSWWLEN